MPELAQLAVLALKASIVLTVFAIGLGATWYDATYLFRNPKLLLNSILARNVIMPIITVLLIKALNLHPAVAIALAVLAVTPVPPLIPKAQLKAGGRSEYVLGLMVSQSLLAIITVPLTIQLMDWALGMQAQFSGAQVMKIMLLSIFIPLGTGMLLGRFITSLRNVAPVLTTIATVLLGIGLIPGLPLIWKAFGSLTGNGTILALVVFVIAGVAVGHALGGPRPEDRTTLALATASRHPAVTLAIVKANFPEQSGLVTGAVLIYLILRVISSIPYARSRRTVTA